MIIIRGTDVKNSKKFKIWDGGGVKRMETNERWEKFLTEYNRNRLKLKSNNEVVRREWQRDR
jgi:hypothetical protein